jgi:hypothetical protein
MCTATGTINAPFDVRRTDPTGKAIMQKAVLNMALEELAKLDGSGRS